MEEESDQGGRACRCHEPNYSSSDNITSSDTFIEESGFSDKASEGGDISAGGTSRQGEEDEGENEKTSHVKSSQLRKISQYERGRQSKDSLPYINKVIREQGGSDIGAALHVQEKVNSICSLIHNALSDLVHCSQNQNLNPPLPKPDLSAGLLSKAQFNNSGVLGLTKQGARVVMEADHGRAGQGKFLFLTTTGGGGSESTKEALVNFLGGRYMELTCGSPHPGGTIRNGEPRGGPLHNYTSNHTASHDEPSSVGSSMSGSRDPTNNEALPIAEEEPITSENVRRLRGLWEQGTKPSCLRWGSKGGLGPLHYGVNSSSRLSRCSFAESDHDIEHCNNKLRVEDCVAKSERIWDAGKHLGVRCSGEEVNIVVELKSMVNSPLCVLCNQSIETTQHLFLDCIFAYRVWTLCYTWIGVMGAHNRDLCNHFMNFHDGYPRGEDFINEGRGFSPTHLKFFLLVFSQI